jgi:hypothetical protein
VVHRRMLTSLCCVLWCAFCCAWRSAIRARPFAAHGRRPSPPSRRLATPFCGYWRTAATGTVSAWPKAALPPCPALRCAALCCPALRCAALRCAVRSNALPWRCRCHG